MLQEAGLDSINFSLHTLDPNAFLKLQKRSLHINNSINWAEECIYRTVKNILSSNKILNTKINCVVGLDTDSAQKVIDFCIKENVKLRLLNDLSLGDIALNNIKKLLKNNNAELIGHEITLISSSHRLDYKIGKYKFGVKCIRQFFLDSCCSDCSYMSTKKCLEGFYGIRLESSPLMVRLCLNKGGPPYVQDFRKFIISKQYHEISSMTRIVAEYLKKDAVIAEQREILKHLKNKLL